jgi:hypothetical protein
MPLDPGQKFGKCKDCRDCKKPDIKEYQSIIGSLLYISISTRPDISHAVVKLSQFNTNPHMEHMTAVKHLLRYLNSTKDYGITYRANERIFEGYSDADWAGCSMDRKSFTGYVFLLAGSPIEWESRKQQSVALSSMEAEYVSMSSAAKEVVYMRNLISEIGFPEIVKNPTMLHVDNLSAIQFLKNPVYHAKSKHIDIKVHHVREIYQSGQMEVLYINTNDMIADIMTKSLQKLKHSKFVQYLGLSKV